MATIWELDFYSRPILDEREKKKWEVLICESPLNVGDKAESLFRYSQFCSSSTVNSLWLAGAIKEAIAAAPKRPEKIRFFRRQMANMITKACEDLDIPAACSRRTLALSLWLEERMQDVYPAEPGYQAVVNPSVQFIPETPVALPDALIGEKWAFVIWRSFRTAYDTPRPRNANSGTNYLLVESTSFGRLDVGFGVGFSEI
jgi:hypothetical protein